MRSTLRPITERSSASNQTEEWLRVAYSHRTICLLKLSLVYCIHGARQSLEEASAGGGRGIGQRGSWSLPME